MEIDDLEITKLLTEAVLILISRLDSTPGISTVPVSEEAEAKTPKI